MLFIGSTSVNLFENEFQWYVACYKTQPDEQLVLATRKSSHQDVQHHLIPPHYPSVILKQTS